MNKVLNWLGKRAKERSTYTGLAIIAGIAGAPKFGMQIDQVGQAIALIAGGGLFAATTSKD